MTGRPSAAHRRVKRHPPRARATSWALSSRAVYRDYPALRPPRIHHANRVAQMSVRMGRRLRFDRASLENLAEAVPLHDIGKLTIPPWILAKRGRLSDYERVLMQTHTIAGARLLRGTREPALEFAADIAECHHEWWDGRGYPHGLLEGAIPLGARIVAVADVFDALVHERPYKRAWPHELAVREIAANARSHFDPEVVEAFLSCARDLSGSVRLGARAALSA